MFEYLKPTLAISNSKAESKNPSRITITKKEEERTGAKAQLKTGRTWEHRTAQIVAKATSAKAHTQTGKKPRRRIIDIMYRHFAGLSFSLIPN